MRKNEEIKKVIHNYFLARKKLFELEKKYPNELSGNDNIIGRIGEYIAIQYLESKGRKIKKNTNKTEKGYDLKDSKGNKISVKIITAENTYGRTTRLKQPWDEIVLILLNKNYQIDKIGLLTKPQFDKALKMNINRSSEPFASRTMLSKKGLFKFGIIDNDVKEII